MTRPTSRFAAEANRDLWFAGEARRADRGLRVFADRIGDAVMCRKCRGDGVVMGRMAHQDFAEPIKCKRCGGEGLEPPE